jgi:dTDP-4-dehydrorhamnose reductase
MPAFDRILVFGDSPFANRLLWYLTEFSEVKKRKGLAVAVVPVADMSEIQSAVWRSYVGRTEQGRPDLIVNAHEMGNLGECEINPEKAWTHNAYIAGCIALAARAAKVPLIQVSSDHVFRGDRGPYKVLAEPNPVNVYGVTKWYGETVARTIYPWREGWVGEAGMGTTILRMSTLFGYDVPNPVGVVGRSVPVNFSPRKKLVITDRSKFSPTFIGEAAFLLARNIWEAPQSLRHEYIHIASPNAPMGWKDLLEEAYEVETIAASVDGPRVGIKRGWTRLQAGFCLREPRRCSRTSRWRWTFRNRYATSDDRCEASCEHFREGSVPVSRLRRSGRGGSSHHLPKPGRHRRSFQSCGDMSGLP